MLSTLSTTLYRVASWKTLLLATVLYIPFPAYILRDLEARMNERSRQPVGPIDLLIGYDPTRIMNMVMAYGPAGRTVYRQGILTADLAYPFIYTLLLSTILSQLFRNRSYTPLRFVNVLPLSILGFDLLENSCIVYLLSTYPAASATVAALCSVLTNLKWTAALLSIGMVLYGLLQWGLTRRDQSAKIDPQS